MYIAARCPTSFFVFSESAFNRDCGDKTQTLVGDDEPETAVSDISDDSDIETDDDGAADTEASSTITASSHRRRPVEVHGHESGFRSLINGLNEETHDSAPSTDVIHQLCTVQFSTNVAPFAESGPICLMANPDEGLDG